MTAARGVRGIVASFFMVSLAATGVVATVSPAGAGGNGGYEQPNCREEHNNNDVLSDATTTFEKKGRHCETLEVTKVVTGTPEASPPPGTQFTVHVSCVKVEDNETEADFMDGGSDLPVGNKAPFETDLTFPSTGGTQNILVIKSRRSQIECTATETAPPGCTLKSIDPETTTIGEPPAARSAEVREPVVHPVTVTNECNPPAQPSAGAAVAVVEVPRFTG
jgi:hypothetical protein